MFSLSKEIYVRWPSIKLDLHCNTELKYSKHEYTVNYGTSLNYFIVNSFYLLNNVEFK